MRVPGRKGFTVLELMIVLAIIGGGFVLVRSGFRMITKADLVENSEELAAVLKRASLLAIEHGEMHRVVIDLDKNGYVVEVCRGAAAIQRNEKLVQDPEEVKRAVAKGNDKLHNGDSGSPTTDSTTSTDPEEAAHRALAVAGQHISDRTCVPAGDPFTGDATGKKWARSLRSGKGIKFKEIWVQHRDDSVKPDTKPLPQVAIYFFPNGSSEKAVIEVTDGSEVFTILVHGLTSRVELRDGVLKDVNDHMMKNVMGDKDAKRESEQ